MSRYAALLTSLAFVPLTLGLVGVGGDQPPLHELVTLGLAGLLILAQSMMLLGGRSLAKGVVSVVMLPLLLALASYALPEYWVTLESWDAMSHGLAKGMTLEAWRPALLTTLSLILVAVLIVTHSQSTLGGPLLLIMAVLLSAQGLLDAAGSGAPLLRTAAGLWSTLSLALLLAGLSVAALPGWRLHAAPLRRALVPSLTLVLAVLLLWYHQKNVTERELHGTVAAEARQLGQRFTREVQDHLTAVERFANVWTLFDAPPARKNGRARQRCIIAIFATCSTSPSSTPKAASPASIHPARSTFRCWAHASSMLSLPGARPSVAHCSNSASAAPT